MARSGSGLSARAVTQTSCARTAASGAIASPAFACSSASDNAPSRRSNSASSRWYARELVSATPGFDARISCTSARASASESERGYLSRSSISCAYAAFGFPSAISARASVTRAVCSIEGCGPRAMRRAATADASRLRPSFSRLSASIISPGSINTLSGYKLTRRSSVSAEALRSPWSCSASAR